MSINSRIPRVSSGSRLVNRTMSVLWPLRTLGMRTSSHLSDLNIYRFWICVLSRVVGGSPSTWRFSPRARGLASHENSLGIPGVVHHLAMSLTQAYRWEPNNIRRKDKSHHTRPALSISSLLSLTIPLARLLSISWYSMVVGAALASGTTLPSAAGSRPNFALSTRPS